MNSDLCNVKPCIILVDPFSSSTVLSKEFRQRGYDCISILSKQKIPKVFESSYHPDDFIIELRFSNHLDDILSCLKNMTIKAVIPCLDMSIELADCLSSRLCLPGNNPSTSVLRFDKFQMIESVQRQGLNTAWQKVFSSTNQVLKWLENYDLPVVVKPLCSAGSDHVSICHSLTQVENACTEILNHPNKLEAINEAVLVQEYLEGDEYVVDTVTKDGKTVTCNVFVYEKVQANGADFVYRAIRTIDLSSPIAKKLIAYNNEVIKAVGISIGAGHSEIIIKNNEPYLIEIGARLHGGNIPSVVQMCAPWSQIELLIDAYINPSLFIDKSKEQLKLDKYILIHFVISSTEGLIKRISPNLITSLDSYSDAIWYRGPGDYLEKTIDLYSCPLKIILTNQDRALLFCERNRLIDLEKETLLFDLS